MQTNTDQILPITKSRPLAGNKTRHVNFTRLRTKQALAANSTDSGGQHAVLGNGLSADPEQFLTNQHQPSGE